jgi:hypothetical protein
MASLSVDEVKQAYNAAIDFAIYRLNSDDGAEFLSMWRGCRWDLIATEYPEFDLSLSRLVNVLPLPGLEDIVSEKK